MNPLLELADIAAMADNANVGAAGAAGGNEEVKMPAPPAAAATQAPAEASARAPSPAVAPAASDNSTATATEQGKRAVLPLGPLSTTAPLTHNQNLTRNNTNFVRVTISFHILQTT